MPEGVLKKMAETIDHRGPDDDGFYLDKAAGLANRRLSIIDVMGGHQPIFNEDGDIGVVFNGEIYNQADLRLALQQKGHVFASLSDTEVLVHLYEEYGEECVAHLNGMFAFAIWDRSRQRGFIARDRLGIKPLFFADTHKGLIFGSEIKALLAFPGLAPEVDNQGLGLYLTLRYLPSDKTIFAGIRKLRPGHFLSIDIRAGSFKEECYWNPPLEILEKEERGEGQIVDEIFDLLKDAVKIRLMSDVPFGAFLSGGLDSSGVVGLMSQVMDEPVKTFSIGFSQQGNLDETSHAQVVSKAYATEHREVDCTAEKVEILPKLIHHFDEPFADPIIVPTYQVSELAVQHVKVVLTGEGADEIFGGYTRFVSDQYLRRLQALPSSLRYIGVGLAGAIPLSGLRHQILRGLEMGNMSDADRFLEWVTAFSKDEKTNLCLPELQRGMQDGARELYQRFEQEGTAVDATARMLYCDMKIRLPECMLARTDRMTMAVSLEGRTPFLDHRLVESAMRLPGNFKVRGRREKYLLKRALSRVLPASIVQRKKQGLAVPFTLWTRYGVEKHIRRILRRERVEMRGFFEPTYVENLLENWGPHAARHSQLIWSLFCLELWCRLYLDKDIEPEIPLSEIH